MPAVQENVYFLINKVPYNIMLKLSKALDAGDKWRDLLAAIDEAELDGPPLEPDYVYVLDNCFKRRQSPTETLLNELGQKGYKVMDLKHWLRLAELNQALALLEGVYVCVCVCPGFSFRGTFAPRPLPESSPKHKYGI